jgi:hypothetical protein
MYHLPDRFEVVEEADRAPMQATPRLVNRKYYSNIIKPSVNAS